MVSVVGVEAASRDHPSENNSLLDLVEEWFNPSMDLD